MKRRFITTLSLTLSLLAPFTGGQPASARQQGAPDDDEVVKISANLVQIDAVVTDGRGRQINDLLAQDFELLEDGKPQQITNFSYVGLNRVAPPAAPASAARKNSNFIPPPPSALRPEQVRRTVALIVDDLSLSFESTVHVRRALKKFIDEQMQPSDLAAIILTSKGSGALQQFTADKRMLYAAVERVRWYPFGRGSLNTFKPIDLDPMDKLKVRAAQSMPDMPGAPPIPEPDSDSTTQDEDFRQDTTSIGTLGAVKYVIQGMQELPGRKSVLLLSDGLTIFNPVRRNGQSTGGAIRSRNRDVSGVAESLHRLTDLANRASVVIYAMDARGLATLGLSARDDTEDMSADKVRARVGGRGDDYFASQDGLNYLARQTGGFFIHDSNDLAGGISKVYEDQRGYYLIGYRPDEATFDAATGARRFHRLEVRLKRPGLKVRTRTGFYGVADSELIPQRAANRQLLDVLASPFTSGEVPLRLTSLFFDEPGRGPFLRNLVHIDGRGLTFADGPAGWHTVTFDILAVTYGAGGEAVDTYGRTETMRVSDAAYQQAREQGLIYTLDVPVKKAGAYQLRLAVRDTGSSRNGSANQFVEVPDIGKGRLALSGVVVNGFAPPKGEPPTSAPASEDPQSNPAVRRIRPGMTLQYAYLIYNARTDGQTGAHSLLTQVRLYREGKLVYEGEVSPYAVGAQKDSRRLPMTGTLQLGPEARPGEYYLQVIVTDQLAGRARSTVTNWADLEIVD